MPSTATRAPANVTYVTDPEPAAVMDPDRGDRNETLARLQFEGPGGEKATAFVSLVHKRGRWYVRLDHDATDYGSTRNDYRQKEIELRFFA